MKRLLWIAAILLAIPLWCTPGHGAIQVGPLVRANCTDITAPVEDKTWCFQQSDGQLYVRHGGAWITTAPGSVTIPLPSYDYAALPTPDPVYPGRLVRVKDNIRGPWIDTGIAWRSLTGEANVDDFGAVGNGTTNDAAAIQACIEAAYAASVPCVAVGSKAYNITTTLNLADHWGMQFLGRLGFDSAGPRLIGNTGAGNPIIDAYGMHGGLIEGWNLTGVTSTIGVTVGCTTLNNAIGGRLRNVQIVMPTDPTANNSTGTIGILNRGGDEVTYENIIVSANLPMVLMGGGLVTSDLSWVRGDSVSTYVPASAFATLAPMSVANNHFVGNSHLVAIGFHRPTLAMSWTDNTDAGALYMASITGGAGDGTYSVAMNLESARGLHIASGFAENVLTAIETGYLWNSSIQLTTNDATATNGPIIVVYGGAAGGIRNTSFRIGTSSAARYVIDQDGGSPLTSLIEATDFNTDNPGAGYTLPTAGIAAILGSGVTFRSRVDFWNGNFNFNTALYQVFDLNLLATAGGVTQHAIRAPGTAVLPPLLTKITGASATLQNTPGLTAAVDFTTGVGIVAAANYIILLKTTVAPVASYELFTATVIYNDTTVAVTVQPLSYSANVNGVTRYWLGLLVRNATTGAGIDLTNLGANLSIQILVSGFIY
jgi:hypothetical protein